MKGTFANPTFNSGLYRVIIQRGFSSTVTRSPLFKSSRRPTLNPPRLRRVFIFITALAIVYLLYVALFPEWMITSIHFHRPW